MSSIGSGRPPGVGGIVVLAILLCAGDLTGARAQTPSATMLRVLAETADQYRTGRQVFFVADYRYPHNVAGPFATAADARKVQEDSGASFGVFGPYLTRPDSTYDSLRVVAISITYRGADGREETMAIDPSKVDALFWSASAIDKFLIPYYSRIYGTAYASILRDKIMRRIPKPVCHLGSHSCWPIPRVERIPVWDPVRGPLSVGP